MKNMQISPILAFFISNNLEGPGLNFVIIYLMKKMYF